MKFNLSQRIQFASAIPTPERGSVVTFKLLKALQEKLYLTPKEVEKYKVKVEAKDNGDGTQSINTSWNAEGAKAVFNISFTAEEKAYLIKYFDELDQKEALPFSCIDQYLELKKLNEKK